MARTCTADWGKARIRGRIFNLQNTYCLPEMIPFYERWGFSDKIGGIQLMYKNQEFLVENVNVSNKNK